MNYIRQKRKDLLESLLGGECISCGKKDGLEFDHVIPEEQSFKIGTYLQCSLEKILPELQKCQLLCFNCHWEKSRTETKRRGLNHGTIDGYVNFQCRCEDCRTKWAVYMKPRLKAYRLQKINSKVL